MGYCGHCGHPVEGRFCGHCGTPVPPRTPQHEPSRHEQPAPETATLPAQEPHQERRRSYGWLPYAVIALLVVAVAGLVVGIMRPGLFGGDEASAAGSSPSVHATPSAGSTPDQATASAPRTSTETTPSSTPPTSTSTDPFEAARHQLGSLRRDGLRGFTTDGHLLIMLSSKCDGITDPHQTTASGSHTFREPDILDDTQRLHRRFGEDVRLLKSTDFGTQETVSCHGRDRTMWVTVYDPGTLEDRSAAESWCETSFPHMSETKRADYCFVRKATPPHD